MLLLLLLLGCLASCAAQEPLTSTTASAVPQVLPSPGSADEIVAILQAAVRSNVEINSDTIGPILRQVSAMIQTLQPNVDFSLSVKKIIRV